MEVVAHVLATVFVAGLVGVVVTVVGAVFFDWLENRQKAAARQAAAERLRIERDALRVKQQLDARAFAARQALFRAAQNTQTPRRDT